MNMTTQREAFEKFYGDYQKPLVPDALDKNADGEYKHYFTRDAIAIWQAALSQPNEPVGDAINERNRLGYAVVKVIGKLDEIIENTQEVEIDDFLHIAVPIDMWGELQESLEDMPKRADIYTEPPNLEQANKVLDAKIAELEEENKNLRTVMMAAAVEITEHWDAHCDAEGYGCTNLVRRLENGYPEQYGYDANTMVNMDKHISELTAKLEKMREKFESVRDTLHKANDDENGAIQDTIWHTPYETLFDFIDEALEECK